MFDKKFAIINSENKSIVKALSESFGSMCEVLSKQDNLSGYDLIVLTGFETEFEVPQNTTVLNLHPSLLPSFKGENAISEAFLAGVKVSGITIHKVEQDNFYGKILAQYPVLIGLTTHIDELSAEISAAAIKLYPAVIDAVLNDRVFDFSDLFKTSCHGCGNCHGDCKA